MLRNTCRKTSSVLFEAIAPGSAFQIKALFAKKAQPRAFFVNSTIGLSIASLVCGFHL
jgi:hypothetical protein